MSDDVRHAVGAAGEEAATEHLRRRGFTILERNFRTRWGELDIVAFDGSTIVFCEVKARRGRAGGVSPLESVHARKQTRVRRMAGSWLSAHPARPRARELRFDAIGVTFDPGGRLLELVHLEGAF